MVLFCKVAHYTNVFLCTKDTVSLVLNFFAPVCLNHSSEIQSKELAFNFLSGNDGDTSHRFEQMRATETGNHSINECSMDIISNNQELSEDLGQGNTARFEKLVLCRYG
ncbi:Hypothetical predicted protein [Podarcis lilfordi]|uniref:Uncharacterized protein n=1 Tax=Podarcis lilfordi TaxID=74358 RepID=A0AA35PFQ0_9SAUR|nr:Hypothetical predicted protein [Podarcis lilfordi]